MRNRVHHPLPLILSILTLLISPLPASPLSLHRDSLKNGLIILTCVDHRLPIVDISFICRSGAVLDPVEKSGVANLCAKILLRGTKNLTADSIASLLEFLGAQYSSGADFDHSWVHLRLLTKDLPIGLDVLADIILKPSFLKTEFSRLQEEALVSSKRSYDNPNSLVSMEFNRLLFGRHRYALPVEGDTSTIPKITIEDLQEFHKKNFVPNNCFIVIVGDVKPENIKELVSRKFTNWEPGPVPVPPPPDLSLPQKTRVKLITRKDMNQTYIHFGHLGVKASDPDLIPVRMMSYILGGPPLSSRIGLAVREYSGLAYDVRCWFDRRTLTGAFHATVQTAKPKEAIEKMFYQIRDMHKNGATPQELLKAKNYFTGSFPLTYSSNQGKLEQIKNLELYRYGIDWLETFPEKVRSTTLEEVNRAAQNRLKPDRYIMVIMGNVTQEELNLPDVEWVE